MIKIAEVQFCPWDKVYDFYANNHNLVVGEYVLVSTELGLDIGKIVGVKDGRDGEYILLSDDNSDSSSEEADVKKSLKPILRCASTDDLKTFLNNKNLENGFIDEAKRLVHNMNLAMKLVAANLSFDNSRITFAFIAEGRVDFRDLVKELTRHFHKNIRLQQLGARDEAKLVGDYGHCGRELCCKKSLKNIGGVSSDLPVIQQVGHRGSERLSGACGRLMCCLRYESDTYVELAKNMPALGSRIKTPQGEGVVIGWHTLRQTVDVQIGPDRSNIVEFEVGKK